MSQRQLIKDGLPGRLAIVGPLLQPCDRVSSLGVIEHDLLGISVIPSASQVDIVPEKVIDSSFNHLEGGGGGKELHTGSCTHTDS